MKHWILAAATLLLMQGVDAREHWGPPPVCPQPKADCCPKPKCPPAAPRPRPRPCPPKECKPTPCNPAPCKPACPKPDPCCPPVCFERGFPTDPCCTPSAYSEAATIDLRCGYDIFFTGSFIYWEAMQGGMDLALPGQATITAGILTNLTQPAVGHSVFVHDFAYKPGFQLGFGWGGAIDNWVLYAEYTWLHGSTSASKTAPAPGVATISGVALPQDGVWIPTSWFPGVFVNNATTHISSKWNYKIDLFDAQMSRPFYSGTRFTLEPFFGLRAAWIRQKMSLTATNVATALVAHPAVERRAQYQSRSAAVGPRVGLNGNWHLGYGIRFIGDASASLLFTGYDVKQNVESPDVTSTANLAANPFPLRMKLNHYNGLRPNLDMSLGFGWGSYFACRRVHWDLAATYDFSIFWEQNMMRYLADLSTPAHTDGAAANLYLHGLTIKTGLDF